MGEELTTPFKEAKLGPGAEYTFKGGHRPDRPADFFCAPIFPAAFPIRSLMPGVGRIQDPSGESRPPPFDGIQRPAPF